MRDRKQGEAPWKAPNPSSIGKTKTNGAALDSAGPLPDILQMQRTYGNRAVGRMLRSGAGESAAMAGQIRTVREPVIQRELLEYMPERNVPPAAATLDDDGLMQLEELIGEARTKAAEINGYVEEGRAQVQSVIDRVAAGEMEATEVAAEFPWSGHAMNFQNKLLDQMSGQPGVTPAAPGGYLIEDYASLRVDGVALQATPSNLRGSRPDYMIPLSENGPGNREYSGLVDATAGSNSSIGHILKKGGGAWMKSVNYPYVAESVYEPLNFGKRRKLSEDEKNAAILRAEQKQAEREAAQAFKKDSVRGLFDAAVEGVVNVLSTNPPDMVPSIFGLSNKRTESMLAILGIIYNPETGELIHTTDFDSWFSNDFRDPYFNNVVPAVDKINCLKFVNEKVI